MRRYGFWNLILDVVMLCLTSGLWGIWIIIREVRRPKMDPYYNRYDPYQPPPRRRRY